MKLFLCCALAVATANISQAAECGINRSDRDFCNAFNTVCLSLRDKSCLAKSLKTCLPQVDLPRNALASLVDYVDQYLMAISIPFPTTESPIGGNTKIEIIFNTGVRFIDTIMSYLASFKDIRIRQSVIKYTRNPSIQDIQNIQKSQYTVQDVNVIVKKIEYLFANFSKYRLQSVNLRKWLVYLAKNKTDRYRWFSVMIDGLLAELGVVVTVEKETDPIDLYVVWETSSNLDLVPSYSFCHGTGKDQQDKCERYCTDSYGGNWILMQTRERMNEIPSQFNKGIYDYAQGFGNTMVGYWMGLGCLNSITNNQEHELLVELTNAKGQIALAHYDSFSVGSAASGYQLRLGK